MMTPDPHDNPSADPAPDPSPDQAAMGLRIWFRRVFGVILVAALLVVIVRGIYVVWQVQRAAGQ